MVIEIGKNILGIIILLLVLGIFPILLGTLLSVHIRRDNSNTITFSYFMGLTEMIAFMQLISVPMTLGKVSFSVLYRSYTFVMLCMLILAVVLRRKYIWKMVQRAAGRIRVADSKWWIVIVFIFIPIIILAFYTPHIYGDDTTYITMVNDILSSDTLYLIDTHTGEPVSWILSKYSLSSYWTWIAYLAEISGLHPLILCKTVLLFFFIPMSYAVYGLLAAHLFCNSERRMLIFMGLLNLVQLFGGFSGYTTSFRLLTWVWQSKAFLAIIVLPFLFYYCNLVFEKKTTLYEFFVLCLLIVATSSTTLTGTGLAVAMVILLALIYAVKEHQLIKIAGAGIACSPALIYMLIYLKYDDFLRLIHF